MNQNLGAATDLAEDGASLGATVTGDTFRLLLEKTARLYDRHEAGRSEPFNVFSVLRSEHDEVNLHSRFLAALLDHRKSPGKTRENLADFLQQLKISDFDHDRASVHREWNNIDLLVRDRSSMQAVIIENKIWAADQPRQLERYAEEMRKRGYKPHVLYLTPDGREASKDSAGDIHCRPISYRDDFFLRWLKGCQERAYDEPELRESVAQYIRLIKKLTGTDSSEAYMNELKELCRQDKNILLVHDLGEAMAEAKISLLKELWKEIEKGLPADLPAKSEDSDISEERIRKFVTWQRNYNYHGLYFELEKDVQLRVEVEYYIFFGVKCENDQWRGKLNSHAKIFNGWESSDGWPLYRYPPTGLNLKKPSREELELLVDEKWKRAYVREVVSGVSELWNQLKETGLIRTG